MSRRENARTFDPSGVGLRNGRFIGLPFDEDESLVVFQPVPWDVTTSYGGGTATGPANILEASPQLDLYHPLLPDGWRQGLFFRKPDEGWLARSAELRVQAERYIDFLERGGQPEAETDMRAIRDRINAASLQLDEWVERRTAELLDAGKIVGVVGGEHSVSLGYLQALAQRHPSFGVLQIDAHMDLRRAYEGFIRSHASIFFNALQLPQIEKLVQVGIRDYCAAEVELVKSLDGRVRVFYDRDLQYALMRGLDFAQAAKEIVAELPQKVYISFDADGLDPALCPHTGTPVPSGLSFAQAAFLLEEVVRSGRTIIGFDLCEIAGRPHEWDGNVGARILYHLAILAIASRRKAERAKP